MHMNTLRVYLVFWGGADGGCEMKNYSVSRDFFFPYFSLTCIIFIYPVYATLVHCTHTYKILQVGIPVFVTGGIGGVHRHGEQSKKPAFTHEMSFNFSCHTLYYCFLFTLNND